MKIDKWLREATLNVLKAQREGQPPSLERNAQISAERRRLVELQKATAEAEKKTADPEDTVVEDLGRGRRIRRLPWKVRDSSG